MITSRLMPRSGSTARFAPAARPLSSFSLGRPSRAVDHVRGRAAIRTPRALTPPGPFFEPMANACQSLVGFIATRAKPYSGLAKSPAETCLGGLRTEDEHLEGHRRDEQSAGRVRSEYRHLIGVETAERAALLVADRRCSDEARFRLVGETDHSRGCRGEAAGHVLVEPHVATSRGGFLDEIVPLPTTICEQSALTDANRFVAAAPAGPCGLESLGLLVSPFGPCVPV